MSRNSDSSVRLVCLASLLAAASFLAGCPASDLPVGSVDAGAGETGGSGSIEAGPTVAQDASTVADAGTKAETPPAASARCTNPTPELIDGKPTGYVRCDGVYFHRAEKRDCPSTLPRQQAPHLPGPGADCATDADCTDRPNGYCRSWTTFAGSGFTCDYGCLKDEDCTTGEICRCGDPVGVCVQAACTTDASCGPGLLCANTGVTSCTRSFACQKPTDQCDSYANCPKGQYCGVADTRRMCSERPQDSSC